MNDWHTHSTASDGALAPDALVERAAACGVTSLALTDHDTVAGVAAARRAAADHGLGFISGVEISALWGRQTVHVVGLGVDCNAPALSAGLQRHQRLRAERADAIAHRLAVACGLADGASRVRDLAGDGQITRAHFAALLVADGLCRNHADAFKRLLKPGRPAHVRAAWTPFEQAIDWIHAAGGAAVLAHPFGYRWSATRRGAAVADFAAAGGDGLEVCTGTTAIEQERQGAREAARHGLCATAGSDFHTPDQPWRDVGRVRALPDGVSALPVPGGDGGTGLVTPPERRRRTNGPRT